MPWRRARTTDALRDVSFSCPPQQVSCLLGPNGAGKTTIVKILAGLVLPDEGEALLLGSRLSDAPTGLWSRIGLATPNERSFYWRLSGRQNLDFYASLYGLRRRERAARVQEALGEVDLLQEADKPFRLYSSGMRQRLLLARALLGRPDVLLLDEPTSHLDPMAREAVHRMIRERLVGERRGTVLLCTNDLSEAKALADHLIFLHNGRVQAEGTLSELRARIRRLVRVVVELAQLPREGWERGLPVEWVKQEDRRLEAGLRDEAAIPDVVAAIVSAGGRVVRCDHEEESLQEVFARHSTGGAP